MTEWWIILQKNILDWWIVFKKIWKRTGWTVSFYITYFDIYKSIKKNGFENEFEFWLKFEDDELLSYEGIVDLAFRYKKSWYLYNTSFRGC